MSISILNKCHSLKNPFKKSHDFTKKYKQQQNRFLAMIITENVSYAPNHCIQMISERSCDVKTGVITVKNNNNLTCHNLLNSSSYIFIIAVMHL